MLLTLSVRLFRLNIYNCTGQRNSGVSLVWKWSTTLYILSLSLPCSDFIWWNVLSDSCTST